MRSAKSAKSAKSVKARAVKARAVLYLPYKIYHILSQLLTVQPMGGCQCFLGPSHYSRVRPTLYSTVLVLERPAPGRGTVALIVPVLVQYLVLYCTTVLTGVLYLYRTSVLTGALF